MILYNTLKEEKSLVYQSKSWKNRSFYVGLSRYNQTLLLGKNKSPIAICVALIIIYMHKVYLYIKE